jgi:hypothetical protein
MNRITRMLSITGLGLVAGVTIGAGPAMAATGTAQGDAQAPASQVKAQGGDRVVGFYRNLRSCDLAGRIGERFGRWDDYDCNRVPFGPHRGAWVLTVSWDHHGWPGGGHHDNWPGGHHDNWPGGGHHDNWPGGGHHGNNNNDDNNGNNDNGNNGNNDNNDDGGHHHHHGG